MGRDTKQKMCNECGQHRLFEKPTPSHVLHLLLTLVTVGFWLPVWFLCCIANGLTPYRCTVCGKGKL